MNTISSDSANCSDDNSADHTFLYVPYAKKDYVKRLGAKWDRTEKLWYCRNENVSLFSEWIERPTKVLIICSYGDKDLAKELGCKWDSEMRSWYCLSNNRLALDEFDRRV